MDVHIDLSRIDIDIKEIGHLHALGYQTVIGTDHGLMEIRMAHVTAIDEEEVVTILLMCRLRLANKPIDLTECGLHFYGQEFLAELPAIDIGYSLTKASRAQVLKLGTIVMEYEVEVRINQDDTLEGDEDVAEFGGIRLEELPPGGYIVKEVLHLEVTAYGTCRRLLTDHLRRSYLQPCTHFVVGPARQQFHLGHCCDGGQGLTTEAHRVKGEEVVGLTDLRCGVTLERESGIRLRHALAVVDDLDGRASGINDDHMDGRRPGINGVLHQFLHHRGRALDHLTSRYLVGYAVGKKMDDVGH